MDSTSYFHELMQMEDDKIPLAESALMIAVSEYPKIDTPHYLGLLQSWSDALKKELSQSSELEKVSALNHLLFRKMRFTGNIENYYDPRNSFLNEVIERRTGIPITLSVLYLELAWNIGLRAQGVSFPGHFLVRVIAGEDLYFVDPFHKGNLMQPEECREFWKDLAGEEMEFQESFLFPVEKKQILCRMLRNLKGIYLEQQSYKKLLPVLDKLVILNPNLPEEVRDRGIIHYQMQAFRLALDDFENYLSSSPIPEDTEVIQQYLQILREYSSHLN